MYQIPNGSGSERSDQIREWIRNVDVNRIDDGGRTLLHTSAFAGRADCTNALLDAGANPNAADCGGYTPLHLATLCGAPDDQSQIAILVRAGADLEARLNGKNDSQSHRDLTPLMLAAAEGSASAVRALLAAGADVNASDLLGMTPLMLAASQTSQTEELVRALIAAGGDKSQKALDGRIAFDFAYEHGICLNSGQLDDHVLNSLHELDEGVAKVLRTAGASSRAINFELKRISDGMQQITTDWPRIIEILKVDCPEAPKRT
jgi:hypothetical protein